jgi:hypothetical protein
MRTLTMMMTSLRAAMVEEYHKSLFALLAFRASLML